MIFLEKDLEDIIFDADTETLRNRGLHSYMYGAHTYRQVELGNYGVADIIQIKKSYEEKLLVNGFIEPYLDISVYELKKDKIGVDTFMQAIRYCKGVLAFISNREIPEIRISFNIVLIGRQVENGSSFLYLNQILNSEEFSLNVYTYEYEIDGIKFKEHTDYSLINEGLKYSFPFSKYKRTKDWVYKKTDSINPDMDF